MSIKILAIDDDTAMTELLTLLLKSHKYTIETANSGQEGIDLIPKIKPDIILLDLMMPEMDGWETCQKIRSFTNTPIVILSALNNPGMVAKALDAGADDYIAKPVKPKVLVSRVKALLKRRNSIANDEALKNEYIVSQESVAVTDDYLIKPVPSSILTAHIENLARRSTGKLKPYTQKKRLTRNKTKPAFS